MAEENNGTLDARSLAAVRGFLVFVVPLGAIIASYFSTRAATQSEITEIRSDAKHLAQTVKSLESDIASVRADLRAHSSLGPGGLHHPAGVIRLLDELKEDLDTIDKRIERLEKR